MRLEEVAEEKDWALEQDLKYNRLTAFKLFAMTSSMVISVNELAPFGKTGLFPLHRWLVKWPQLMVGKKVVFLLGLKDL